MSSPGALEGRSAQILFAIVVAVAAIGFFVGIDDGVPKGEYEKAAPAAGSRSDDSDVVVSPAVTYDEIGLVGPAAVGGHRYTVADLGVPEIDLSKEVEVDVQAKPASLADRALRRAFNGAPPTVPHDVEQMSDASCVACHATALKVSDNSAPIIPHTYYANCQQCHVAESPLFDAMPLAENSFVGLPTPTEGDRAWTGAPPVVPHATWMRENCRACHGPMGRAGLRTSHPGRTNCLQCHARSASLDPYEPTVAALIYDAPAALFEAVGPPRVEKKAPDGTGSGAGPK